MTTIKDAPVINKLTGSEKFPISDGSGMPVTATIQQVLNKVSGGGIPLVEELDPDASLGTLVRYKQYINIDKIETVNKTCSIRDLTYRILDPEGNYNNYIIKGDIITKINFLTPNFENIPSKFKCDCYAEFLICSDTKWFVIGLGYYEGSFEVYWVDVGGYGTIMYDNQIYQENIEYVENFFNNSKIYYSGIFLYPNSPISIEECFDFLDYFITVDTVKEIKTTEEIKVIPYIKQQYGWESLITENSDFNNDFNLDFN